jgi:hypothetical protein
MLEQVENDYNAFKKAFHRRVKEESIRSLFQLFHQPIHSGEVPRVVMDYYRNEVVQYDEDEFIPESDRYELLSITGAYLFGSQYCDNPEFYDGLRLLIELLTLVELRLHANSWSKVKSETDVFKILKELKAITDWAAIWLVWETVLVTISKNKDIVPESVFVDALKELATNPSNVDGIIRRDFND